MTQVCNRGLEQHLQTRPPQGPCVCKVKWERSQRSGKRTPLHHGRGPKRAVSGSLNRTLPLDQISLQAAGHTTIPRPTTAGVTPPSGAS